MGKILRRENFCSNRKLRFMFPRVPLFPWLVPVLLSLCFCSANAEVYDYLNEVPSDAKKLIVLIHGWNRTNVQWPNSMYDDDEWSDLVNALTTRLAQTDGDDWHILRFHWEEEASTGGAWDLEWDTDFISSYENAVDASIAAISVGGDLGITLGRRESLREVHFIAHSAGTWVAHKALTVMMQRNDHVVTQLTLLDPFIPDESFAGFDYNTGLSVETLEALGDYGSRLYRLENYFSAYVYDLTPSTDCSFDWRDIDINTNVSFYDSILGYYEGHGGPVDYYSDSINASRGVVPAGQAVAPWNYSQLGFFRSLLHEYDLKPYITQQPIGDVQPDGASVTLSVAAESSYGVSYAWYYEDSAFPCAGGSSYSFTLDSDSAGEYVVCAYNDNGMIYSDVVTVSISQPDSPAIDAVSPQTLPTSATRQTITIAGGNFSATTTLRFHWNGETYYSQEQYLTRVSDTQLQYDISVETDGVGQWTVVAVDGEQESVPYAFTVVAAQVTPLSLGIEGAASMFENDSESYTAKAYYSDGSSSYVTPFWSEDSSVTTISTGGELSAGSVSSDTMVTLSASFTANGVIVTDDHEVMVLNSGSGGGDTVELIENGDFSDDDHWTTSANFYADDRFSNSHSDPGYAYLSLADGSPGDNLNGEIVQYIDVPEGATDVTLKYWYHITTVETGSTAYDYLGVNVIREGDGVVESETLSNVDANSGYQRRTIDLSGVAGDRLLIGFGGSTDYSNPTVFRIDDVSVEATVPPELVNLAIEGPSSVLEGQSAQYTAIASFDDGSEEIVDADDWDEDSGYASISNDGLLDTEEVARDRSVGIDADYTVNGVRETAFKRVTIVNVRPTFTGVAISGPTVVDERSVIQYEAEALYSDGTSEDIVPLWTVISPFASISAGGSLGIGEVRSNSTVTVTASFTEEGVMQVGTLVISVNDISNPRVPVSLSITGPSAVPEERFGEYIATVHYDDGFSITVDPDWIDNSDLASISMAGTLSVGSVLLDTDISIGASYTEEGLTVSDSKTVTIVNDTTARLSANQIGLTHQITLGESVSNDVLRVSNRGDGTVAFSISLQDAVSWASVTPESGSVTSNEALFTVVYSTEELPVGIHSVDMVISPDTADGEDTIVPLTIIVKADVGNDPYTTVRTLHTATPNARVNASAPDGGVIMMGDFSGTVSVGGQSLTSAGDTDVFAVRFDSSGNVLWVQQYGGVYEEQVESCVAHPSGGWVISGVFEETGVFGSSSVLAAGDDGKRDAYIARLDESGTVLWVRRAGGAAVDYGECCAVDSDGNCILFGEFTENCTFDGGSTTFTAVGTRFDLFVVKYSATGGFMWAVQGGGSDYDTSDSIGVASDGSIYIGGRFTDTTSFGGTSLTVEGSDSRDAYVAKISSGGAFQWARRFGEPSGEGSNEGVEFLTPSSAGGMFFGGYYDGPWTIPDATLPDIEGAFAGRIAADGTVAWVDNVYADHWADSVDFDYGLELADGGLVVAGRYRGQIEFGQTTIDYDSGETVELMLVAKFDALGAPLWALPITSTNKPILRGFDFGTGDNVRIWISATAPLALPGYGTFEPENSEVGMVEFGPSTAGVAPIMDNVQILNGALHARFFGAPTATYELQRCHSLVDADWQIVRTGVISDLGWVLVEDTSVTNQCFYRVVVSP